MLVRDGVVGAKAETACAGRTLVSSIIGVKDGCLSVVMARAGTVRWLPPRSQTPLRATSHKVWLKKRAPLGRSPKPKVSRTQGPKSQEEEI
ncbi:hypothetical protein GN244_ATG16023 [Phytophthora infestans]|uniref:Uncharacterized protein n=1 Tax=Phytophthora infestans TaxID=4787 RepID=A0A833SUE0_PHYIN|nr:hypothetical protein GN244_ATG16023 [Phytophthora infestans]KAF4143672.1 hypothetical protein GN958_ATG07127 [Phytophthora infestans]